MLDLEREGACPRCRSPLVLDARAFSCRACRARWPIVRGVPRFVDSEHYVGSFGYQWRRYARTQVDRYGRGESEATFRAKTGLGPEDVSGRRVLDVGVGTGRFSDVVGRWGGVPVGADLSLAVESARRNLAPYQDALVVQADLFRLPFREETFDAVFSIGVIHHTPSTRDAFRAIARFVRPGGILAVAVYEDHPRFYRASTRFRRETTQMSHSLLHLLSHAAVAQYHVRDLLRALGGPFGPHLAGRFHEAFPVRDHEDPRWRVLDTFDWYSPRYQWKHTTEEVIGWFRELGFEDVRRLPEDTMVSVRGRRGAGPLATPPPSAERRSGAPPPLPGWVPGEGPLRDLALLSLLGADVVRSGAVLLAELVRETASKLRP